MTKKELYSQHYNKSYSFQDFQNDFNYAQICDVDSIRNTIMHELIHSMKDCMCHTGRWKIVAQRINYEYNYDISRTTYHSDYHQFRTTAKPKIKKYKVTCNNCGQIWNYCKQAKIVKALIVNPHDNTFKCPYCQSKHFSLITLR